MEKIAILRNMVNKSIPKRAIDLHYLLNGEIAYGKCPECGRIVLPYNACPDNDCRQYIDWE